MSTFFFTEPDAQTPYFNAADPRNTPLSNGYVIPHTGNDLYAADGNYIAAIGTYDPGAGWQPFWTSPMCTMGDAWVFAPKSATIPFGQGATTTTLQNGAPQCPTVNSFNQALTVWNFYPNVTYESGKQLDSIKSWHFSKNSLDSDAIEEFYFTKQYGKTRWERWVQAPYNADDHARATARCPTGTDGGESTYGTSKYYLVDCHDWSRTLTSSFGDWDPSAAWHVDPLYNSINLLRNTHMQCTSSGVAKACTDGGICQTIAPWGRIGDLNWAFIAFPGNQKSANCNLVFSIPTAQSQSQSIYQDVSNVQPYTVYTFGAALWVHDTSDAQAIIRVWELDNSGNNLAYHDIIANLSEQRIFFEGTFNKLSQTTRMRFQVYPMNNNRQYDITDAWIAPKP